MNKIILYTQRVEVVAGYNERRDCADQQIANFIWACGFVPVPVNNLPEYVGETARRLHPSGVLFTGGNDLEKYGGDALERDQSERILLEYALQEDVPLFGFCRGMQFIADYFGSPLTLVKNHAGCRHIVTGELPYREVNSYHNWRVAAVPEDFRVLLRSDDGTMEAFQHKRKRILGIMWHPEREKPFRQEDIRLFSAAI